MIDLSKFDSKEELYYHLVNNKSMLVAQKKSAIKHAEPVSYFNLENISGRSEISNKRLSEQELLSLDKIRVKSVINTTNLFDSHYDVHIDKIWNKTLKEQKVYYLVKEHKFDFDNTLSDEVEAYINPMSWKQLGYEYIGNTQALIFDSIIYKKDNEQMFEKYIKGKVRNHSIGMQYVKLYLAINSEDYKEEKEVWDKYYPAIGNKADVDSHGYFWAVTEAKIIEGSAVTRGSNFVTPTRSVTEVKNIEPSIDTRKKIEEPVIPLSFFEKIGSKI